MRTHGFNPSEEDLRDMIRNVDKNANGAIDFNEFIEMMLKQGGRGSTSEIVLFSWLTGVNADEDAAHDDANWRCSIGPGPHRLLGSGWIPESISCCAGTYTRCSEELDCKPGAVARGVADGPIVVGVACGSCCT